MTVFIGEDRSLGNVLADWEDRVRQRERALTEEGDGAMATVVAQKLLDTHLDCWLRDFEIVDVTLKLKCSLMSKLPPVIMIREILLSR